MEIKAHSVLFWYQNCSAFRPHGSGLTFFSEGDLSSDGIDEEHLA